MQLPMAMADGNGNDNGDDEQREVSTIDDAEWRQRSNYDCGLRMSPRLQCLILTMTYTWFKLQVQNWWSDAGHSGGGDMEDGVTLDVPSFSFPSLYFFTSLDRSPLQIALARIVTTSRHKSGRGGILPRARSD